MPDTLKPGDAAPLFTLNNAAGKPVSLPDFAGQWAVLYFYPKDNTGGCTREARDFSALLSEFRKLNTAVIGVSPDSESSHARFIERQDISVELLSDPDREVCNLYGVWRKKKMAGREYMGVVRSTFLIDPAGTIEKSWYNVRVNGHAENVLNVRRGAS
ncbi:MAG TPA: peroxiredoxin [Deltaproteobacteria bacterium]|nr:peroxiredoxin [Deltaproteobacteria bacterium]